MEAQEEEIRELIRYGVNGIFTDFPEMVLKMRTKPN
jgi:glycerophosphoryl diester phosphodiesterase